MRMRAGTRSDAAFSCADLELTKALLSLPCVVQLTNVPLLDLRYLRPYSPAVGFAVHVDAMRRLPWTASGKTTGALVAKCALVTLTQPIGLKLKLDSKQAKAKAKAKAGTAGGDGQLAFSEIFVVSFTLHEALLLPPRCALRCHDMSSQGRAGQVVDGAATKPQ
jgi:hypothetical protein